MTDLVWLSTDDSGQAFPPVASALTEPNGLLAVGGGLEPDRLINAYRHGIFPWYEAGQPVLWWSPDPRAILVPGDFNLHRSLRKNLRKPGIRVTFDKNFAAVISACAAPRQIGSGTWITAEMQQAYILLHKLGFAHSVEVWSPTDALVGGLYGLSIGKVFFGESMFSRIRDASKIALATLACQLESWGFGMIDCQQDTTHLASLGATTIKRKDFIHLLNEYCNQAMPRGPWILNPDLQVDRWHPGNKI